MLKRQTLRSGFTFIEVMVVVGIIGILAAIGIASFANAAKSGRDSKRMSDIELLRQALVMYRGDNAGYPAVAVWQTALGAYVTPPFPADPTGTGSYVYTYQQLGSGTGFCICALMENNTKGNSAAACTFNAKTHYCAINP